LFFPKYASFCFKGGHGAVGTNNPLVRTTAFTIEGMSCEGCSALVEKVIRDVPGVLNVNVDYEKKLAMVATEECCPAPADAIIDVLRKAGYRAAVVELTSPVGTGKADAQPIDPDRQILFTVVGFT
jgi:copper chaperone CopZ